MTSKEGAAASTSATASVSTISTQRTTPSMDVQSQTTTSMTSHKFETSTPGSGGGGFHKRDDSLGDDVNLGAGAVGSSSHHDEKGSLMEEPDAAFLTRLSYSTGNMRVPRSPGGAGHPLYATNSGAAGLTRGDYLTQDDLNLPPGRMHAVTRARLSGHSASLSDLPIMYPSGGSGGIFDRDGGSVASNTTPPTPPLLNQTNAKPAQASRRNNPLGTPRSRSRSPHVRSGGSTGGGGSVVSSGSDKATGSAFNDGNSSISSLEDMGIDTDIIYDRAGLIDNIDSLVEQQQQSRSKLMHNSREFINLPPVNERLSEETLEDVHAFSDCIVRSSNASRVSTGTGGQGGNAVLGALDECEEEDDLTDDEDVDPNGASSADNPHHHSMIPQQQIILTNMENLALVDATEGLTLTRSGEGADLSLIGEAPSAPTA